VLQCGDATRCRGVDYDEIAELGHSFHALEWRPMGDGCLIQYNNVPKVIRLLFRFDNLRMVLMSSSSPTGTLAWYVSVVNALIFDVMVICSMRMACARDSASEMAIVN